jgi:pterin-4a-carbinolamine dehydratase
MTEENLAEGSSQPDNLQSKLKAERIQEKLKAERIQEKLKAERIQDRLSEVPGWQPGKRGLALTRTYDVPSIRAAGLLAQLMLEIGEALGYIPRVAVNHLEVTVTVRTSEKAGITDLDFDFVRALDSRL